LIGRAEALRRSMVALIKHGALHEAHPSTWGPFALVGEGGSSLPSQLKTQTIAPQPASTLPSKGSVRAKQSRQKNDDWPTTIWKNSGQ